MPNLHPHSRYEARHRCRASSVACHYRSGEGPALCITQVKWRINGRFGVSRVSVVWGKAGMYSSVGSRPRTHQSEEMMSCDSNYVKKVDTCKGAANWNQYASPFITNRQLINGAGALQLTRGSFTQLPARLDSRCSAALFKEHCLGRAGVNNWLFSPGSMHCGSIRFSAVYSTVRVRAPSAALQQEAEQNKSWILEQAWGCHSYQKQ